MIARHCRHHGEQVFFESKILANLDWRYQHALVVLAPGRSNDSTGFCSPGLTGMYGSTDKAHQFIFVKHRYRKPHIRVVYTGVERVVIEKAVTLAHTYRGFIHPMLDDVLDRYLAQHRMVVDPGCTHGQVALGGKDTESDIPEAHGGGGPEFHCRFLALKGNHVHLVLEDIEVDILQQFLRSLFSIGNRFGA